MYELIDPAPEGQCGEGADGNGNSECEFECAAADESAHDEGCDDQYAEYVKGRPVDGKRAGRDCDDAEQQHGEIGQRDRRVGNIQQHAGATPDQACNDDCADVEVAPLVSVEITGIRPAETKVVPYPHGLMRQHGEAPWHPQTCRHLIGYDPG